MNLIKAFKFMKQETFESVTMYQGRLDKDQLDMITEVESACSYRISKPIIKNWNQENLADHGYYVYYCPTCNQRLLSVKQNYCIECGQALDIPKEE